MCRPLAEGFIPAQVRATGYVTIYGTLHSFNPYHQHKARYVGSMRGHWIIYKDTLVQREVFFTQRRGGGVWVDGTVYVAYQCKAERVS